MSKCTIPDPRSPLRFEFKGPIYLPFMEQAARVPQSKAIVYREECCTYAELDEISSRLADYLRRQDIGVGDTVVLFSNRNSALVYAILGVLKSGAAFFIADAAYPVSRIVDCIALAGPSFLLVCGELDLPEAISAAVKGKHKTKTFQLQSDKDTALKALAAYDPAALPASVDEKDAAYISFTSGSTGKPKGIITTHAPLPHFLRWHIGQHGLGPNERFSLLSGLSHDPALRDIFTPLYVGASLHIPDQTIIFDPFQLSPWLAKQAITVLHLTPALGQVIFSGAQDGPPLNLIKYFFWGGDALSSKLSKRMRSIAPNATQVNFYGTTETPQAMSCFVVDSASEEENYPIGTGIADVQLLVMASGDKLAAVDEVGEIYIRTPYLSRGYLKDPERTRACFVANPFTNDSNDRCYKTGDMGKYLGEGNVAFAGRLDHQVKIRGFRVELDEVRSTIEQQPGIAQALVMAQDLGRESKVLVAYFTCDRGGRNLTSADVQKALKKVLPSYMAPSYIIKLDEFQLLPNGKINLLTLPDASQNMIPADDESAVPLTKRERELAEAWQEILGIDHISVNDSFTDLGGDSLSAIQVLLSMRRLGISENISCGILQGKTISQIVREEQGGIEASVSKQPLSLAAHTSLLVNLLRGILVIIVVTDHWFPGLLQHLPRSWSFLQETLEPLFSIATPGFALVFGMNVGYNLYPRYLRDINRFRNSVRLGVGLLSGAVLFNALFSFLVFFVQGQTLTWTAFFNSFFGAMLYYLLAMMTIPLWFRFISRFRSASMGCLVLMAAFYTLHFFCQKFLLDREQTGFLQLCRLMLVSQFAYFNMSFGVLGGTVLSMNLSKRQSKKNLPGVLLICGALLGLAGLSLLYWTTGNLEGLRDPVNMRLWRWLTYSGAVLVLAAFLNALLNRYEHLPDGFQTVLKFGSVVGQCSLLIFVLHFFVLQIKTLLYLAGLPEFLAVALPLLGFLGTCGWVMRKVYRLYYGSVSG
jgi:amino acid adenylation domain-containing protein